MKLSLKHLALCALALTLAACGGGGKIYQPFTPTVIYTFGDGLVDAGQTGTRYTINSTDQVNKPTYSLPEYVAKGYGLPLLPQAQGGNAWGQGKSTVAVMQTQISARLAAGSFSDGDLIIISAGMEDVMRETESVLTGAVTLNVAETTIKNQAQALLNQLMALERAGARHIYVIPPYDMGRTPWAFNLGQTYPGAAGLAGKLSDLFYNQMLVESSSRYSFFPASLREQMKVYTNPASSYIATKPACKSPGSTDASACFDDNLEITPEQYVFADGYHPTPGILRSLAGLLRDGVQNRW